MLAGPVQIHPTPADKRKDPPSSGDWECGIHPVVKGDVTIAWPFSLAVGGGSRVGCRLSHNSLGARSHSHLKEKARSDCFEKQRTKLLR